MIIINIYIKGNVMFFFTRPQITFLAGSSATVAVATVGTALLGFMAGDEIGSYKALNYANDNGCGVQWAHWIRSSLGGAGLSALEACGVSCEQVCETADNLWTHSQDMWTVIPGGVVGTIAILTVIAVAIKMLLNNNCNNQVAVDNDNGERTLIAVQTV